MPKFPKGSQEAKDFMKSIREKRTTISDINYETFKGKKSKKNITLNLEKDIETLPSGEKIIKSTTSKKMNGNPVEENINQVIIPTNQKKKGGRPKKYNTVEEAKQAKKEKTLASNKKKYAERKALKANKNNPEIGGTLDIGKSFAKIGNKIEKGFNKNIAKPIDQIANKAVEYGKAVIYGRNDYPPKVRNILKNVGNQTIKSITIKRTPVSGLITGALSVFSLGKFGKRMERSFDELFHLFIEITLNNNQKVILEKNEVINMESNPKSRPDTEMKIVNTSIPQITLDEMLNNTEQYMGQKDFFGYSAKDNNCQDFIVSFFKANNIGDESDISFIKQDTKSLFKNLPSLRKLSNTITTIGAKANVITTGKGIEDINNYSNVLKHLTSHITDPNEPIDKRDYKQAIEMINAIKKQKSNKLLSVKNKISNNNINMSGGKIEIHHYHHMIHYPKNENDSDSDSDSDMEGGKITFKSLKKGFENISGREFKSPQEMRDTFGITDATKMAKVVKKGANKTSDYITSKKGGLSSDLVTYGIPATTAGILGALGNVAGGPVAGVAASALGSKIGSEFIAPAVQKKAGTGVRKSGRFAKGSQEAKEWGRKMKEAKEAKK